MTSVSNYRTGLSSQRSRRISFSTNSTTLKSASVVVSAKSGSGMTNFSNKESDIDKLTEAINFSLVAYIREQVKTPREVIRLRISHIVRYVNSNKKEVVVEHREYVINYLRHYLYNLVFNYIQNLKTGVQVNLILALGVGPYIHDTSSATDLQRNLKLLAKELVKRGTIRPQTQELVNSDFQLFFAEIIKNIELQKINEDKRGILSPSVL